jgi:hypothetical protein
MARRGIQSHTEGTARQSRNQNVPWPSRSKSSGQVLAMPRHGQDARGTKPARAVSARPVYFRDRGPVAEEGLRTLGSTSRYDAPPNQRTVIPSIYGQIATHWMTARAMVVLTSFCRVQAAESGWRGAASPRPWMRRNTGVVRSELRPQDDSLTGGRGEDGMVLGAPEANSVPPYER